MTTQATPYQVYWSRWTSPESDFQVITVPCSYCGSDFTSEEFGGILLLGKWKNWNPMTENLPAVFLSQKQVSIIG